jgi:hypothetical protein
MRWNKNNLIVLIANPAFLAANLKGLFVIGSVLMSIGFLKYFVRSVLIKFVYRAYCG